jgi:hypothetical protein
MKAGLLARFDTRVLRVAPPRPLPDVRPDEALPLAALRAWCLAEPARRFAVQALPPAPGVDLPRALEALQRDLDGDFQLRALPPGWPRISLRLRVKAVDALPTRWRPMDAPWDAGYLADGLAVRAALAQFLPRRPTLMVADAMTEAALRVAVDALTSAAPQFRWPVRLIVPASLSA